MRDCSFGADIFAAMAEDNAAVWVFYDGFPFAVFLYVSEGLVVAEVYAFAAGDAFGVVYFGCPWDLVSGDSFVLFFFWHRFRLHGGLNINIFKYCYEYFLET